MTCLYRFGRIRHCRSIPSTMDPHKLILARTIRLNIKSGTLNLLASSAKLPKESGFAKGYKYFIQYHIEKLPNAQDTHFRKHDMQVLVGTFIPRAKSERGMRPKSAC